MTDEDIADILQKELGYYKVILELSLEEQSSQNTDSINRKKKIIMSCIHDLEDQIKPFKKNLQHEKTRKNLAQIKKTIENIFVALEKIPAINYNVTQ